MKRILRTLSLITPLLFILASAPDALAYYDPGVQRWINRDPVEEQGGVNLFLFCKNNAVQNLDATGYKSLSFPSLRHPKDNSPLVSVNPGWFNTGCCINAARKDLGKDLQEAEDELADCTEGCGIRDQCLADCRTTYAWSLEVASIKYLAAALTCLTPGLPDGQDWWP